MKFLKWFLIIVAALIVLPIGFFFIKGLIAGATSPYASDAYHPYTHPQLDMTVSIPNDCTQKVIEINGGMQCESSVYTYDRGQKEGYLLTVFAKTVSDHDFLDEKGNVTKTLTGEEAWKYELDSLCKMMSCFDTKIEGNPAVISSLFSPNDPSGYNAESVYIYRNGIDYVLSVRAANQDDAKVILRKMRNSVSWTK